MFLSPLVVFSLVFTVGTSQALPASVESAAGVVTKVRYELIPTNFAEAIKEGVWYIEFIAPLCDHCHNLRPTYEHLLVSEDAQHIPDVSWGQVNCSAHWDLCQQQRIYGYPTILTYEDGVKTTRFKPDHKRLTTFIDEKRWQARMRPPTPTPTPIYLPNPEGRVIPLDSRTFQPTIDAGPTFVMFGVWCLNLNPRCKNTWYGTIWTEFALEMKGKATVAEVNCLGQNTLCHKLLKVAYYPSVYLYQHGEIKLFRGVRRNFEALQNFAVSDAALVSYIPSSRVTHSKPEEAKSTEPIRVDVTKETSQALPETQVSTQTSLEDAADLIVIFLFLFFLLWRNN